MYTFVIYGNKKSQGETLLTLKDSEKLKKHGSLEGRLLKTFEAETWDEACQIFYDYNGNGIYIPPDFSNCTKK